MRSNNTPTGSKSKSPFAINRKSQIADTSSFIGKENTQSTFNNFLSNICKLSKSRPMVEVSGTLMDASAIFGNKEQIGDYKSNTRRLESDLHRKNNTIECLQRELEERNDLINRLEAEKESMGDAFAMMQAETLNVSEVNQRLNAQNSQLKRQLSQHTNGLKDAMIQIQELKSNLEVYQSLDPRLKQLQELQNTLIEQNGQLKIEKERHMRDLKAVIKNLKSGAKLDSKVLEALVESMDP